MKRHESIAPLSREHHANLILAQLLKSEVADYKGMPTSSKEKLEYALNIYNKDIKQHFLKEEMMLDKISHHPEITTLAYDIKKEHELLRNLFEGLKNDDFLPGKLNELGLALDNHIRKEERVLFPLIQKVCSEDELVGIAELIL